MYQDVSVHEIPAGNLTNVDVDEPTGNTTRGRVTYDTGMVLAIELSYVNSRGSWLVASVVPVKPGDRSS